MNNFRFCNLSRLSFSAYPHIFSVISFRGIPEEKDDTFPSLQIQAFGDLPNMALLTPKYKKVTRSKYSSGHEECSKDNSDKNFLVKVGEKYQKITKI